MALRVPTVNGPQIEDRPLQGGFQRSIATPENMGGGAARQIGDAGRAMQDLGMQMQEREDADMLMRAETEVKSKYLQWEGEAKQRKGQQAWGVAKEADQWWEKEAGKIGESLTSQRQKFLFDQKVTQMRGMSVGAFAGYEAGQRRESLDQSAQASILSSINMAAANPGNGELIQATKADIQKRNQARAQINGWDPVVAENQLQTDLTNLHKQVIQGLVDKDPKAAQDYFAMNKAEIAGQWHSEIEKVINVGAQAMKAQEFADQVMASGMDEAQALAEARAKLEGDAEKNAVAEIKVRFAERTGARERMQRDAADQAYAVYAKTGSINAIPASVMSRLDGRDLLALRRSAEERADRAANREVKLPPTDWDKYYELRRQATEDPEAFKQRDLRREFPHLGKAEREGLIDLQSKKPEELKDTATFEQQLNNMHDLLKLSGAAGQAKRGRFDQVVTDAIRAEEKRLGKKLDYDGRQKIIDRMAIEGTVERSWALDPKKRAYELTPEERAKFTPKVPAEERSKIEDALKRIGKPVTDEAVLQLYREKNGL